MEFSHWCHEAKACHAQSTQWRARVRHCLRGSSSWLTTRSAAAGDRRVGDQFVMTVAGLDLLIARLAQLGYEAQGSGAYAVGPRVPG